ncbi:MAG: hypothetical protein K2X86_15340 [Cytophagaceae bacterium]|nr:hypothetical protein [Cytophagaceae bacterium]
MKTTTKLFPVILFLVGSFANVFAITEGDSSEVRSLSPGTTVVKAKESNSIYKLPVGLTSITETKKTNYKRWKSLGYSGYIRSFNQYRHLPVRYPNQPSAEDLITLNGLDIVNGAITGYQEPLFLLRLEGAPTVNTNFKLEYAFDHQMTGLFNEPFSSTVGGPSSTATRRAMAYRVLQFTAGTHTRVGDFTLIAGGGVNWYRLSPFTMWNYEYRDDMFDRYPWEPEGVAWGRYNRFYGDQNIARDARWGNTGTQGFILQGKNLPLGFGFSALYGKTDNSGGFQSYKARTPKNMAAGRLEKGVGRHKIGVNYFSQFGFTNTTGKYKIKQQILTADGRLNFNKFKIFIEGGIGRYQDSVLAKTVKMGDSTYTNAGVSGKSDVLGFNYNWAPCFNFNLETFKELTFIPLNFQFFYVDKSVVNVNSAVLNSANTHALSDLSNFGQASVTTTFLGAITDIGQMTNNRWGTYLKHEGSYGKLKVIIATGMSQELQNMFDSVSFWHKANSFTRSRFAYFQNYLGPYGRIMSIFRRTYETIGITDSTDYLKGYNTLDLSLKYKFRILNRELILANYMNYNSVQKGFSAIPQFSNQAFIRTFYEEVMAFYALHPKVTVIGFFSWERVLGNMSTELADASGNKITDASGQIKFDPAGRPVDQTGYGYGVGLDYDISGRAGLFLRHRWFEHSDKNFTKDTFKGMESTIELKIFF